MRLSAECSFPRVLVSQHGMLGNSAKTGVKSWIQTILNIADDTVGDGNSAMSPLRCRKDAIVSVNVLQVGGNSVLDAISVPPSPENLEQHFLVLLMGGSATAVLLVSLLWCLYNWYGFTRDSIRRAREMSAVAQRALGKLRRLQRLQWVLAVLIWAVMFLSQALWLGAGYVIGNLVAMLFGYNTNVPQAHMPTFVQIIHGLRPDLISGSCVIIWGAGIIMSYKLSSIEAAGLAFFYGIPGSLACVGGVIAAALMSFIRYVVGNSPGASFSVLQIEVAAGLAVTGVAYVLSCQLVLRAPSRMFSLLGS